MLTNSLMIQANGQILMATDMETALFNQMETSSLTTQHNGAITIMMDLATTPKDTTVINAQSFMANPQFQQLEVVLIQITMEL